MTKHKFPFSIAYADTDAGGIVYHGRYIEIAERARMNWLRGHFVADGDLGFVVRELAIKYLHPLKLGDDFVVESEIVTVGAASMDLQQKFVKDDVIYAILNVKAAYLGIDMKPKRIPESILKGF
ncbi:MAG: thioesterase family protein [Alphaproteobacteria bacterium]|nr:thioesterase family protein [Alphaproteobacteria bacterium]